jgi:hypothetical protein
MLPGVFSGMRGYYGDSYFNFELVGWREIGCGEELAEGVLGADGGRGAIEGFEGPGDVEGGVIPEDGAFSGGVVEVGGFVKDFCCVR